MNYNTIPTCHFPSTVLFVDDSRDFLLNFVLQLDEGLAYRIYDSPMDALARIKLKQSELEQLSHRCASEYSEAQYIPSTSHMINLDLAAIHAEIYNPYRFDEISVVVVDYAMPGMNGIEFCRSIEDSNIKKILLTGQADESVAIQAFNDGLIQQYIKKSNPHAAQLITEGIERLQQQYFLDMSSMVVKLLSNKSPLCLQNKNFASFFRQLRHKKGIVEFYLADNSGSFLLLDGDGNVSFLIMKSEQELQWHHQMAVEQGAPSAVIDSLKRGEKIPCYWQMDEQQNQWDEWATFLLPAAKIPHAEQYFYAYVEGPLLFPVRKEKILTYNAYLDDIDAQELMMA